MSINRVNISGNLTRDPELTTTKNGLAILKFGVAVNDRARNAQGEWEDRPNFVECVMFGNRATALQNRLYKGLKVAIEGKLRYSSWQDSQTGANRSKLEVIVDELEFMSSRTNQDGQAWQPRQGYSPQGANQSWSNQSGNAYSGNNSQGAYDGGPTYNQPANYAGGQAQPQPRNQNSPYSVAKANFSASMPPQSSQSQGTHETQTNQGGQPSSIHTKSAQKVDHLTSQSVSGGVVSKAQVPPSADVFDEDIPF